jgi:hypothetical protein
MFLFVKRLPWVLIVLTFKGHGEGSRWNILNPEWNDKNSRWGFTNDDQVKGTLGHPRSTMKTIYLLYTLCSFYAYFFYSRLKIFHLESLQPYIKREHFIMFHNKNKSNSVCTIRTSPREHRLVDLISTRCSGNAYFNVL